MSTVLEMKPTTGGQNLAEMNSRLEFQRKLQIVTNKIHATTNIDEIMIELSQDICSLFDADRLTVYVVSEDKQSIVSKVKTGLSSFKDLRLPITDQSIAGFVGQSRRLVNVRDVYDESELKAINPNLRFLKEVDKRTGYRTKQMLVAPILDGDREPVGVIQIINTKSGQPFSAVFEEGAAHLGETLAIALKQRQRTQTMMRGKYDFLVANAVLSAEEMELATRSARRKSLDIEDILMDEFQVKPAALGEALAQFFGASYEPYRMDRIKPNDLLRNLKRDFAESQNWVPVEENKEGVMVITTDPERVRASRVVNNVFPRSKIVYKVCSRREFVQTLDQLFGVTEGDSSSIGELLQALDDQDIEGGILVADEASLAEDNEVVKLVNKIIVDAYHQGASDIHVEPYPGKGKTEVRFRKDGTLVPYITVPSSYRAAITARLKIMCDLDISEKRKPQDGKIRFKKYGPLDIELRVATVPTQGGMEDVVMRILAAGEPIPMDKLALSERNLKGLIETVAKPYGIFFVCGPTGSGKTTTLHSVLGYINTPETKIWTAEDPVEITQKGLRQVQMNNRAGLNFATAMRAFLRSDPDVIMVGEMRDKETVAIGIEASLTGHLVFSTLHTNSATESIVRLLDMGMDPFNFSDALLGILAQRLAKRLCGKCKQPHVATADELKLILDEYCLELQNTDNWKRDPKAAYDAIHRDWSKSFADEKGQITLYTPVGCETCTGSGYKGRIGLHELLLGTDTVKRHVQEGSRVAELLATGLNEGMRTLRQDGIEKVLQGLTDLHQVRAVCIK